MRDPEFLKAADLGNGASVCLYGAGKTGRQVLEAIRSAGGTVTCFLDTAADRLGNVGGLPVLAPFEAPCESQALGRPVIITVFNRDVDTVELATRLLRHGYGPIVWYPDLHSRHRDSLGDHFWLGDPTIPHHESDAIASIDQLWSDDRSREVFRSLVRFYRERDPRLAPRPSDRREEYLAPDVREWLPKRPLRLIDCGAFDGDTLDHLRASGLSIEAAACFEPDPENFRRLRNRLATWSVSDRRGIFLWPCGVAERSGNFAFASGLSEASRIGDSSADSTVACVALDDALPGFDPNMIKMDVEGAEEGALRGAAEMIREHRPGLAISVYHRPADLWQLPALVDEWNCGYRFFLRSYGFNGFDTVCYAVHGLAGARA